MKQKVFAAIFFILLSIGSQAQTSRIFGKVIDEKTGNPIPDAHIFIPNTTFQAFSDSLGGYMILGIPDGRWEILARGQGWNSYQEYILLKSGIPKNVELRLSKTSMPDPVIAEISKGSQAKMLDQVMETFVGEDFKKRDIGLLNPDKLFFEYLKDKTYRVHSEGPIFFSNNETGYLVSTYFKPFILGSEEKIQAGFSYFELPDAEGQAPLWRERRMEVYQDSPQRYLSDLMTGVVDSFDSNPSPEVSFAGKSGDYLLDFTRPLVVNLSNGNKGEIDFKGDRLEVKFNGAPVIAEDLQLGGAFSEMNPIQGIPKNFNAEKLIKLANLEKTAETMQERIFVHTDRKHYWPGEMLYFKAYLNYGNPLMAEDLSKVLHVELLDSTGYILMHRVFKINSGVSWGNLALPDQETGNFFLRAYTAWGQNFRDADFFQPIQILGHQYQPVDSELRQDAVGIRVFSDKQSYEGGEKVKLNVMAFNASGHPVNSNLSVTILDLNQAVVIPEAKNMEESFQPLDAKTLMKEFPHHPETGFSIEGQLLDKGSLPIPGSMRAFINGYTDVRSLGTDKAGMFELLSSNFDGEFEIALQATDKDARPVRNVSLEIKNYPTETLPKFSVFPVVVSRGFHPTPDIQSLPDMEIGEILMEEAIIEDKREVSIGPMIYGQPDKVVKTEDIFLNGTPIQFLYALSGQVAGMSVYGTPPAIRFRGGEPLVLVNGAPINSPSGGTFGGTGGGQTAYDVIRNLDILSIERVEVIRGLVPQYGDQGRNGLISIILKSGLDRAKAMEANMNNYTIFKFEGYPRNQSFEEIEKYRKDFPFLAEHKPTLFWNPNLVVLESQMSQQIEFTLNERTGPIWIEIKGITDLGEPIHGTFLINPNLPVGK